ncbi:hypothetical protein [Acinetobacter johnsonii]|uniref:hypothetical protein n=1 Tax=Acinetobacter johnsonii TaxID=40214 RepID=UPI0011E83E4F|nr:hypothetical protein [Acinetobacter johnsonii]QEK36509.1 hypothetical protein FYN22_11950 [Acinetobacter johnsonii]
MSYAITNEIIDIDQQIEIIKVKRQNMKEYEEQFIHHKSIENFYDCLKELKPEDNFLISKIYGKGRDTVIALNSIIFDSTYPPNTPTLKKLVDHLSVNLEYHKNICESTYRAVEERIHELEFYEWSILEMINICKYICADIDQISDILNLLKQTKTYRLQKGSLQMDDIDPTMKPNTTIQNNYNAPIQQSMIQSGHNNTMTVNQINNQALQQVCNQMREIIDQSNETPEAKQNLKDIVSEVEATNNPSTFKDAYTKLTSALSNHLTILGAFGSSGILTELTKYLG